MPFYENQPTIYPLYRLLEEVLAGEIRIPRFQRPGTAATWRPQQRGDLLDSIYRGFPIGTILLWSTRETIATLPVVGGADIPHVSPGSRRLRLVLDGHQRLSTLISILGPSLENYQGTKDAALASEELWVFEISDQIADDVGIERFKLLRREEKPQGEQVPLNISLDRVQLNDWVRKHKKLGRSEVRRVDSLRDRLREYSIPVATLAAESLDVATETFKRINSSGTPMSDFHMVAALAYTNKFDPQERFEQARMEYLDPEGWGDMDDADILRVCAGLVRELESDTSQHPAKLDIDRLGKALRKNEQLIERAGESVRRAAVLLRETVGVHGLGSLPYSWQLIVLAIELGARQAKKPSANLGARFARWFWMTTYGGVFAGVNSAVVDRASRALHDMLADGDESPMLLDIGRRVEEPIRFDFRAARARALMLAMARVQDKGDTDGAAHRALAKGSSSIQTLVPRTGRSKWFNLVIEPDHDQVRILRDALRQQASGNADSEEVSFLSQIGFAPSDKGDVDRMLHLRRTRLLVDERRFVEKLKFDWREPSTQR